METRLLTIEDQIEGPLNLNVELSFESFQNYLRERLKKEPHTTSAFLKEAIEAMNQALKEKGPITQENLAEFEAEFQLIYKFLVPPIATEQDTLWGLGFPIRRQFFYSTSSFYELMQGGLCQSDSSLEPPAYGYNKLRVPYSIIFRKCYGFHALKRERIVRSFVDAKTGLNRYYQISIDDRFVDVRVKGKLPRLDLAQISPKADKVNWDKLTELVPLSQFHFSGFSVVTIKEITTSYALENIKDIIMGTQVDLHDDRIINSLKTMVGDKNIDFALIPFLKLNGRVVHRYSELDPRSPIINIIRSSNLEEKRLEELMDELLQSRTRVLVNAGVLTNGSNGRQQSNVPELKMIREGLKAMKVASYALIPISHHGTVVGVFEIFTKKKECQLNENILASLEDVSPLLAQILENARVNFEQRVDQVIKEKFTSLQSAVQWKFNEKALDFLENTKENQPPPSIGNILFKNVYPLYGAVDIRNSTVERNRAFQADMEVQLGSLKVLLEKLHRMLNLGILEEMIFTCSRFLDELHDESMDSFQMRVIDFLERDVEETLHHFRQTDFRAATLIENYQAVIDPDTGKAFANRRNLEASIHMVNEAINGYLELFNVEVQSSFPCYFEKFRTDGVEYDIYIGQSIAPNRTFSPLYLKNIRLWQLTSMAAMASITSKLAPQMKVPLETTQLIFVNVNPIDISFRPDERRFDVEGTYNIRYEIIKKRIDKITLKDSDERLTQPGKIAMVYMNARDIEEYKDYILFLQNKRVLLDDLEELELESLHDVSGLKGLRVGVNYDHLADT